LKIHSGKFNTIDGIEEDLKIEDLALFKYAPITSVDHRRNLRDGRLRPKLISPP
jgi:hypothetical protein